MQPFNMPKPYLGQMVWWYPKADTANGYRPAIVTDVGPRGVAISVFHISNPNMICVTGVRHMDDPTHKDTPTPEHSLRNGGWTFCEQAVGQYAVTEPAKVVMAVSSVPMRAVGEVEPPKVSPAKKQPVVPEMDEKLDVLHMRFVKGYNARTISARMGTGWDNDDVKNITGQYDKESALALLAQHRPELVAAGDTEGAD